MKKVTTKQCPACGSIKVTESSKAGTAQAVYGPAVPYDEEVLTCHDCQSVFADEKERQDPYLGALEASKRESIAWILDQLPSTGYSLAAMERALELPQRTLSRWKSGNDLSAAGLALLRIIGTYPWILEVADAKFDERAAKIALGKSVFTAMHDLFQMAGYRPESVQTMNYMNTLFLGFHYTKDVETVSFLPPLCESANSATQPITATGV